MHRLEVLLTCRGDSQIGPIHHTASDQPNATRSQNQQQAELKFVDLVIMNRYDVADGKAAPDLRVVDFGACFSTSAVASSQLTFEAQTLPYRAPEVNTVLTIFACIGCPRR